MESNYIRVFYSINDVPMSSMVWEQYLSLMPPLHQESIQRYHRWKDRQASLLGKLLLLKALSCEREAGVTLDDIKYTPFNKPYFDNYIAFNISHSGGYVVCAISSEGNKVGVDVEYMKEGIALRDFDGIFTDLEWQKIHYATNPLIAFYDLWTKKESVVKADGRALSLPLKSVEVRDGFTMLEGKRWYNHELVIHTDYKCFLSSEKPILDLEVEEVCFAGEGQYPHAILQNESIETS